MVITGRNEVVAKVMFLHVSVILFTGGVSRQGEPPPAGGRTPPGPGRPPLDQADPPGQGEPSRLEGDPPGQGEPPRKQTPEYGLRATGTHPTGMHSYLLSTLITCNLYTQ